MPKDLLKSKALDIHPKAVSFHEMLSKAREFASGCINNAVLYNKERWNKSHKESKFKIGDKVLISTVNFNNIQGPRKLKDSYVGPFVIIKLHGPNAVDVALQESLKGNTLHFQYPCQE